MDPLHHVAIQVDDIERAVKWYRERFSVKVRYADDSWAIISFANVDLALVRPHQHPPHIAVERSDAAQFGALTAHRDGTHSTYIEDLDGNFIEMLTVPAEER